MGCKNIYVITGEGWNRDSIVEEIEAEDYDHDFYFGQSGKLINDLVDMVSADEVWCFGECDDLPVYEHAIKFKLDLWKMG